MEMFHAAFSKLCSQVSAVKPRSTSANPAPVSTMARAATRSAATAASVLQVRWAPASCSLQHCSSIALVSRQKKTLQTFFPTGAMWMLPRALAEAPAALSVSPGEQAEVIRVCRWGPWTRDTSRPRMLWKSTWLDSSCESYPGRFSRFVNASTAFPTIPGPLIAFYDDTNIRTKPVKKVCFSLLIYRF